jgi:hypothetical protein
MNNNKKTKKNSRNQRKTPPKIANNKSNKKKSWQQVSKCMRHAKEGLMEKRGFCNWILSINENKNALNWQISLLMDISVAYAVGPSVNMTMNNCQKYPNNRVQL